MSAYRWFRMSDQPEASKAAIPVTRDEAAHWNTPELGFGIFTTVNAFNGPRRKDHLAKICAWAVDMDDGSKEQQQRKLLASPLVPSVIVETKRGYQAWWCAKDGKPEHWNAIVLERLVPFFGADKNARDLCRILRVPGFLHLKDPTDPFMVREVHRYKVSYTERQIGEAFEWVPDKQAHDEQQRAAQSAAREEARRNAIASGETFTESFWEAVYHLDCEEGLRRLSGRSCVGGEQYTFRRTGRGNLNLFVGGKSSSCFIDENKRIGSLDGGGPTLVQWLRWFKHDWKTIIHELKTIFPHLEEIDRAEREQCRRAS